MLEVIELNLLNSIIQTSMPIVGVKYDLIYCEASCLESKRNALNYLFLQDRSNYKLSIIRV